jgi:aspartate aminotransferase
MSNSVAHKINEFMKAGSWIRKMFEQGAEMKSLYGPDNVFDFSLGNPMGEPPEALLKALRIVMDDTTAGKHGYMPNAGYPDVREKLASTLSRDHGVPLEGRHLVMTVGAAGALNVSLKALINPGDTVMIFSPFFVEYRFYIDNVNGNCKVVPTDPEFNLNVQAVREAMDPSVKALIINTPNNPTGRIYPEETLSELAALLEEKTSEYGHPIYVFSDEPYKRIAYDGIDVPSLLKIYRYSLICTSFSKEMSVPGERLGYIAVNPDCPGIDDIMNALTFCNRILGFVNAPALMQRALGLAPDACVDITQYQANRNMFMEALRSMGYEMVTPEGAFYLFVKSPVPDEVAFVADLAKEKILAVPGRGFGCPGYFRLAYCVSPETIQNALPGFRRALDAVG